MGTQASKISLLAVALEQPQLIPEWCNLIEFLEPGKTINAIHYVQILLKLCCALRDKCPRREVILQHDNTRPHTAHLTLEKIENMGWEPHPPSSTDMAPSDYHIFGFVKNQMRGQLYEIKAVLQTAVHQCFWAAGTTREYSNFQNGGKNVYRETGIM
jgi:histone-lysine N-methyltransferase SETMAR